MKINERNLIHFALSKTPVDREGWLYKRGEVNKSFQKRWFLLKGNMLFYFDKKDDKEPIGVIILEGCTIELAENEEVNAFKLVFHGAGNRTYVLGANKQEEMEDWMKAVACASYDYMKLMVIELQRQLEEITQLEKQAKSTMQSQLRASGLPMNRSDSCLCNHTDASVKVTRFNPFDKLQLENDTESYLPSSVQKCETETVRMSCAVSEDDLLRHNAHLGLKANRQKYMFIEIHEYYGQIFRRIFDELRRKRAASQDVELITFD